MSVVNVLSVIEREHSTPVMSVVDSIRLFIRNFGIAYGIRSGMSVFLRAFHLATTEPSALLSLDKIFGEAHLQFRADAVRWGLFLGWTTGGYCLVHGILQKHFGVNTWNCMVSGAIAGLGAIVHGAEQRRTLALYSMARVFQCCYNEGKRRGLFTPLKHGDSLLFAGASAQIMYAYVMRPETLPLSYWNFIVRSGPIPKEALAAVRMNLRGKAIDLDAVKAIVTKAGGSTAGLVSNPVRVGCEVLHPGQPCLRHDFATLVGTFRKTWPLYATLTFVPMGVLKTLQVLRHPISMVGKGLLSVSRSALFLASFCAAYQTAICGHHKLWTGDTKALYYLAGWVSSAAIFIEEKKRRSELALYALPRAIDSVYMMMRDYKWLGDVPLGELWVFCLSLSALMFFYHEHPYDTLSPVLSSSFNFLFKHKKRLVITLGSLNEPIKEEPGTPLSAVSPDSTFSP